MGKRSLKSRRMGGTKDPTNRRRGLGFQVKEEDNRLGCCKRLAYNQTLILACVPSKGPTVRHYLVLSGFR
jgi:hypothetical protein